MRNIMTFFLVLTFAIGFSPNGSEILRQLTDSKSQDPVVYANVAIKDKSTGVIANDTGNFR